MDCSLPRSSVHGIIQAKILKWVALLQGIFLTQGSNLHLLHGKKILYHLSHREAHRNKKEQRKWRNNSDIKNNKKFSTTDQSDNRSVPYNIFLFLANHSCLQTSLNTHLNSRSLLLLLLLLSRISHVRLCVTPQTASHLVPRSLGFSRQDTGVGCHSFSNAQK